MYSTTRLPQAMALGLGLAHLMLVTMAGYTVWGRTRGVIGEQSEVDFSIPLLLFCASAMNSAVVALALFEFRKRRNARNQELEKALEQLQQANSDFTRLAYSTNHDLREPVRRIGSYITLLKGRWEGKLDGDADRCMRHAEEGARRLQKLLDDLLAYATLPSTTANLEAGSLEEPVCEAVRSMNRVLRAARAQVHWGDLPDVCMDASLVARLFCLLFSNSIRFAHPDREPEIRIGASPSLSHWAISVSDNGNGFDPEYAKGIFALFSRLHPVGRYPGSGTGLATARKIVSRHGGRIWAESQPGVGTTIWFTLPAIGSAVPESKGRMNVSFSQSRDPAG